MQLMVVSRNFTKATKKLRVFLVRNGCHLASRFGNIKMKSYSFWLQLYDFLFQLYDIDFIFMKREDWLWLFRLAETCRFLVLCIDRLFHCYVLH